MAAKLISSWMTSVLYILMYHMYISHHSIVLAVCVKPVGFLTFEGVQITYNSFYEMTCIHPSQSWLMWPGKGSFGALCGNGYLRDPTTDKREKIDGWMDSLLFPIVAVSFGS